MMRDIWTKTLWDNRRSLAAWAIGITAVSFIYGGFYPLVATPAYGDLIESMPEGLTAAFGWEDITSPAGYLGSTVFGLLGPVLVIIFALSLGTRALAGDEEAGTLELLMTLPVTRTRIVLQRAFALTLAMAMAGILVFLAMMALRGPADIDIPISHFAAASTTLALLGLVFGLVALFLGSVTGRRGLVLGISAGLAVASYLANSLAGTIEGLAWARRFSVFHYVAGSEPLRNGFPPRDVTLLVLVCIILLVGSVVIFGRRDVGT